MKTIRVVIDENGKVTLSTHGYQGEACIAETEQLLKQLRQLGIEVNTDKIEYTAEYYQQGRKHYVRTKT